jgi:hypothetical protein
MSAVDTDCYYTVEGWSSGIAWRVLGPVMIRDEDYEWSGIEYEHEFFVRAVMVGDDKEYQVDAANLKLLDEEDFCSGCGQVGCGHG